MIIHIDGANAPGTPSAPEFVKATVYLPPSTVVTELPDAHGPLAGVVQVFIENVGLHTKIRWERVAKSHLGKSSMDKTSNNGARPPPSLPLHAPIPVPNDPGSAILTFHGRKFSMSATSTVSSISTATLSSYSPTPTSPPSDSEDDMYVSDNAPNAGKLASSSLRPPNAGCKKCRSYQEREKYYQEEIHDLKEKILNMQREINVTALEAAPGTPNPLPRPTSPHLSAAVGSSSPSVQASSSGKAIKTTLAPSLPPTPSADISPFASMGTLQRKSVTSTKKAPARDPLLKACLR